MKWMVLATLLVVALAFSAAALAYQRRACENAPSTRLIVRERGRVSDDDPKPVNVRAGPNTSFDPPIGSIPVGGIFYVVEEPECSPRYAWYRVEYIADGEVVTGWIAEGSTEGYFVETYPPGE